MICVRDVDHRQGLDAEARATFSCRVLHLNLFVAIVLPLLLVLFKKGVECETFNGAASTNTAKAVGDRVGEGMK